MGSAKDEENKKLFKLKNREPQISVELYLP